jgi:OH-DDVA oxygenase
VAELSLALWTTHGPTLSATPQEWLAAVPKDRAREHWYEGKQYSYEQLLSLHRGTDLEQACSQAERTLRHAKCQAAIEALAARWAESAPDVCIIVGNDQRELFHEDLQSPFVVYNGASFFHEPLTEQRAAHLPPGIRETDWAYRPETRVEYDAVPQLAQRIFELALEEEIDLSACAYWAEQKEPHYHTAAPHAFGFVIRRIMREHVVPMLPVFINTFYPPNQPSAARCFKFGQLLGRAVREWGVDKRVAIIGSGGLTHFVVNEALDQFFLRALRERDRAALTSLSQPFLMSGDSELRNWIAAAGAVFASSLEPAYESYVPCYRSPAGTGAGNGFAYWI